MQYTLSVLIPRKMVNAEIGHVITILRARAQGKSRWQPSVVEFVLPLLTGMILNLMIMIIDNQAPVLLERRI